MTGMMRIDDRKGNNMIFIGITGGVGAGKSAVLSYLKELDGVKVMLSDEIAHELMEPGSDCYNRLRELFAGEPIWLEDGHFDRPALAGVIFSDDKKRELLNAVVDYLPSPLDIPPIKGVDEDGNEVEFEFLDLINYDDEQYVVLLPTEEESDEPGEVVILRVEDTDQDSDEESYVSVEDEEVLNKVFEIFKEKFKDDFDFVD